MSAKTDDMIQALEKAMQQHGYALVSTAAPADRDGIVARFVVAGDAVLAERLRPLVINISGLEIMLTTDLQRWAHELAADAVAAAAGRR